MVTKKNNGKITVENIKITQVKAINEMEAKMEKQQQLIDKLKFKLSSQKNTDINKEKQNDKSDNL